MRVAFYAQAHQVIYSRPPTSNTPLESDQSIKTTLFTWASHDPIQRRKYMKSLKLVVVMVFAASLLVFAATLPNSVKGFDIQEAPTTDLNVLTDDLYNGLGNRGAPVDECAGEAVPNRSFEDNKFIFD